MKKSVNIMGLLGLFLTAAGGVVYAIKWEMTVPVAVLLWGGVLLCILFIYVNFSEIRGAFSGRSVKYGANAAVMIAVFTSILAAAAIMSVKYKGRWDLTATKRYTLSDQTLKILKTLKRDVEIIAFYRSDERTRQSMDDILQNYSAVTPRLKYWFIDPDKKPGEASKYGITSYRTTLVKSGGRQEIVSYESEEKLTNALLKVTKDEIKTVYFLAGHGENSMSDAGKLGYKTIKEAVEKENFAVKELTLVDKSAVPEDAAVVIVSGPKKDLMKTELDMLSAYTAKGGSVFFMIDPYTAPGMTGYLAGYGVRLGNDIIVDTLSKVFGANYLVPVATSYEKDHPITAEFTVMTFFPLARSVGIEKNPDKGSYVLVSTGPNSWAEIDKKTLEEGKAEFNEGKDARGPVPIAAVTVVKAAAQGEGRETFGKVAAIGDSDFVNNTSIDLAGNRDFFLNTVSWLAAEADLISIRKKEGGITPLLLTAEQARFLFWMGVVIPPSFVGIIGIGVFMRRRLKK